MPTLNKRKKLHNPSEVGDVVLIIDDVSPRGHYTLARIIILDLSNVDVARSAVVRASIGVATRPTVKLANVLANI